MAFCGAKGAQSPSEGGYATGREVANRHFIRGTIMAMYMLMAKYSTTALKAIMETGSDREAAARQAVEAAGGKLHGFYGMFGQEYGLAMIVEAPGHAEYIGAIAPAISSGVFDSYKTIPLYSWGDVAKALPIAKKVRSVYRPPGG
jgi:uncharacterized protein with GYD domain